MQKRLEIGFESFGASPSPLDNSRPSRREGEEVRSTLDLFSSHRRADLLGANAFVDRSRSPPNARFHRKTQR